MRHGNRVIASRFKQNGCAFAAPYEILNDAQCENHCFSVHLPHITIAIETIYESFNLNRKLVLAVYAKSAFFWFISIIIYRR